MTIAEIQKTYFDELSKVYDVREARSITKIVLEKVFELNALKLSMERFRVLTSHQREELDKILERLKTCEPVQYVLEEADFSGLKFNVNKHVLIPRPETEELVAWVNDELRITNYQLQIGKPVLYILDLCTGSGCIPVTIAKENPSAIIEATDISNDALEVAKENNRIHGTGVRFFKHDILTETLNLPNGTEADTLAGQLLHYDIIISNPPYIAESEKELMAANVLSYEPHLALFATGNDDLIFYRRIAEQAIAVLKPGGRLFFEINEAHGKEVTSLLETFGFIDIELRKDLSGKERMVKGVKPGL